jgi:hypothetical protein
MRIALLGKQKNKVNKKAKIERFIGCLRFASEGEKFVS